MQEYKTQKNTNLIACLGSRSGVLRLIIRIDDDPSCWHSTEQLNGCETTSPSMQNFSTNCYWKATRNGLCVGAYTQSSFLWPSLISHPELCHRILLFSNITRSSFLWPSLISHPEVCHRILLFSNITSWVLGTDVPSSKFILLSLNFFNFFELKWLDASSINSMTLKTLIFKKKLTSKL